MKEPKTVPVYLATIGMELISLTSKQIAQGIVRNGDAIWFETGDDNKAILLIPGSPTEKRILSRSDRQREERRQRQREERENRRTILADTGMHVSSQGFLRRLGENRRREIKD